MHTPLTLYRGIPLASLPLNVTREESFLTRRLIIEGEIVKCPEQARLVIMGNQNHAS